ncbi:hypothetical protein JW905_05345 [bacterium]|nr:hypothetical protein [candidate division CSSED10-310 bacterium]
MVEGGMTLFPDELTEPSLAGGKGARLLTLGGIDRVPAWFVIPASVAAAHLRTLNCPEDAPASEWRDAIMAAPPPAGLAEAVHDGLARLGCSRRPVAVRSSAAEEDAAGRSYAGQFDSFLNVTGATVVIDAIKRCWASRFNERSVRYAAAVGQAHGGGMAVLVQRQVAAAVAGVMFTANPVSGRRDEVVINALFGLGEGVVNGMLAVDMYRVYRGVVIERLVADKESMAAPAAGGGIALAVVAEELRAVPCLSDSQVLELAARGLVIQAHCGAPQDIEWCLAEDGWWFLQSRPITTMRKEI